jgi:DNA-binding MarR family transcriptional regulator
MSSSPCFADFYREMGFDPSNSAGYLMRRVLTSLRTEIEKELETQGVTQAQWEPLFKLRKGMATTVAELARETQNDPGATTRLLDRLEAKGLCRRERSTEDRRVVKLQLTPEGEAAADKVPAVLSKVMNAHLAGFTHDEWQALLGFLRRMLDNGEAYRSGTVADGAALSSPFTPEDPAGTTVRG